MVLVGIRQDPLPLLLWALCWGRDFESLRVLPITNFNTDYDVLVKECSPFSSLTRDY